MMTARYILLETSRAWRNRRFLIFTVFMPLAFFFLWSNIFGNGSTQGISSKAYLMTSMAAYGTLTAAVSSGARIAIERASGWNRQLRLTALAPWSYFVGKVAVAMVLAVPSILLVFLAGGLLEHVQLSAAEWVTSGVALWVGLLPFAALGVVVGYTAGPDAVQAVAPLITLGLSLLGGLWIPVQAMPTAMADAAHAFPSYWLGELARFALAHSAFDGRSVAVLLAWTVVFGLLAVRLFRRETARGW